VRLLKVLFALVIVILLAGSFVMFWPYGPDTDTFVEIAPGTGTISIAQELQKSGVIRSAAAFEVLKEWKGRGGVKTPTLKAGEYRFNHPAEMEEVYDRLVAGDVYTVTLVIPEGFNIFDVAGAVSAAGLDTSDDFLAAEKQHTELIAQWSPGATSLEGYLFPDTYRFNRHSTALQMLTAMVKRFGQQIAKLGIRGVNGEAGPSAAPQNDKIKESVSRLVTMASLVEREVHIDSERPVVAGVFENRLAAGMPLQTDPAVVYASLLRGTWTGVIHQSELHSDSAYNTYGHAGLPPGPICNPGVASLTAALHPAQTKYLYFVAQSNGATRFAETLNEHNANVLDYRKSQ
jgi:UPF0755 protein